MTAEPRDCTMQIVLQRPAGRLGRSYAVRKLHSTDIVISPDYRQCPLPVLIRLKKTGLRGVLQHSLALEDAHHLQDPAKGFGGLGSFFMRSEMSYQSSTISASRSLWICTGAFPAAADRYL